MRRLIGHKLIAANSDPHSLSILNDKVHALINTGWEIRQILPVQDCLYYVMLKFEDEQGLPPGVLDVQDFLERVKGQQVQVRVAPGGETLIPVPSETGGIDGRSPLQKILDGEVALKSKKAKGASDDELRERAQVTPLTARVTPLRKVIFYAKEDPTGNSPREGEHGWYILVETSRPASGKGQIELKKVGEVRDGALDISSESLEPLWAELGLEVVFDYE